MDRVEHDGVLDSNRRELVDVEKSAVVDLFSGDLPKAQTVCLRIQQPVEFIERTRIAGLPFEMPDCLLDCFLDLRALAAKTRNSSFDDLLFSGTLPDFFIISVGLRR